MSVPKEPKPPGLTQVKVYVPEPIKAHIDEFVKHQKGVRGPVRTISDFMSLAAMHVLKAIREGRLGVADLLVVDVEPKDTRKRHGRVANLDPRHQ